MSNQIEQRPIPEPATAEKPVAKPNYLLRRLGVAAVITCLAAVGAEVALAIENLGPTREVGMVNETVGHNENTDSATDRAIKKLENAYDMQFSNDAVWNARNEASRLDPNPQPGDILNYFGTETPLGETEIDVVFTRLMNDNGIEHYDPSSHTIIIDSPNTH